MQEINRASQRSFAHDRPYRTGGALLADNITSPSNNAAFTPSTSISVTANASDADGTISQVQFFDTGNNLLGSITQAPYSFTMSGLAIGSYGIYAIATDNNNATTSSGTILFSVVNAQTLPVFYIQTDQLNTPRLITNGNNTPVWRWDNLDPFADNIPNDDPANTGNHFTFNQRFPGQYFDKETNSNYNYYRDNYFADLGRYGQSDPIGLEGGINTYAYVEGNPLSFTDKRGLAGVEADPAGYNSSLHGALDGLNEPGRMDPLGVEKPGGPNHAAKELCHIFHETCPSDYENDGVPDTNNCRLEYPPANACTPQFPEGKPKMVCGPRFEKHH